jgi:hypothetical protein
MKNLKTILLCSILLVGAATAFVWDKVPRDPLPTMEYVSHMDAELSIQTYIVQQAAGTITTYEETRVMAVAALGVFFCALLIMHRREYVPPETI